MRRESKKTAARRRACKPFRETLKHEVGRCEICGHDPNRVRPGWVSWVLHVHEIARGSHRQKALDKPFAVLVVCYRCHSERLDSRAEWPEARQLAALKVSRPQDYDLPAFNTLVGYGPRRVTQADVDAWLTGPDRRMEA